MGPPFFECGALWILTAVIVLSLTVDLFEKIRLTLAVTEELPALRVFSCTASVELTASTFIPWHSVIIELRSPDTRGLDKC